MKLSPLSLLFLPALAACLDQGTVAAPATPDATAAPDAVTIPTSAPTETSVPDTTSTTDPRGFVVHEWGTFTSVQSSKGESQPGLHHEDEELPGWVYRRDLGPNAYFEELPEEPLQQLETPVVYFYSEDKRDVRFHVDFPEGIISQWFPAASAYAPAPYTMTAIADGTMTWDVTVDPTVDPKEFLDVDPQEIWAPARNVASTPVVFGEAPNQEKEQFIFYRGLGNFDLPVRVTAPSDTLVHVRNESPDDIAAVVLLNVTDAGAAVTPLGPLSAGATLEAAVPSDLVPHEAFVADARAALVAPLIASGLYRDEAEAMVATWTRSWFGNLGLRVLYVVPRAWTDRLLPLEVSPQPTELVRTLVGRIEVMTPAIETETWAEIGRLGESPAWDALESAIDHFGRFAEPWLRHALATHGTSATAGALLDAAHQRP